MDNHGGQDNPFGLSCCRTIVRTLLKFTPPLRVWLPEGKARRGSRAFCAKADSVGGKMRFIAIRIIPPTESLSGLRPQLFVGLPEEERPTLKGGVISFTSAGGDKPLKGGVVLHPRVWGITRRDRPPCLSWRRITTQGRTGTEACPYIPTEPSYPHRFKNSRHPPPGGCRLIRASIRSRMA